MSKNNTKEAIKELTLMLLYLTKFSVSEGFDGTKEYSSWKGYNFDTLDELEREEFIYQGRNPGRRKSIIFNDEGIEEAKKLLVKYGIDDWKE